MICRNCDEEYSEHCPECGSCNGAGGNCTNSYCELGQK